MQGECWQTEDLMFHRALSSFVHKQVSGFCIFFSLYFFLIYFFFFSSADGNPIHCEFKPGFDLI